MTPMQYVGAALLVPVVLVAFAGVMLGLIFLIGLFDGSKTARRCAVIGWYALWSLVALAVSLAMLAAPFFDQNTEGRFFFAVVSWVGAVIGLMFSIMLAPLGPNWTPLKDGWK